MKWEPIYRWARAHARLITYTTASIFITLWTLLRFFTARTIFDLVGQQVLAGQWLHGTVAGSSLGVTNYIPKIFILYMPLHLLPGSPRLKLLFLTIAVNVATILLLGLILERLLRFFRLQVGGALWCAVVWLGAIAGSVFWIQFTNSRNLEVAAGLLLLYLGLRYFETPSPKRAIAIAGFSSLLFFADPLQMYMTGLPLLAYDVGIWHRDIWRRVGLLAVALAGGFIGSKVIFLACTHLLHIQFISAGTAQLSGGLIASGGLGAAKAFVHLYAGGADAGKLREVVNLAFLALGFGGVVYGIRRRLVPKRVVWLVGCVLVIDTAVYILSGQAKQPTTERYLIMTAPALMLLMGSLQKVWQKFRLLAWVAVGIFLAINFTQLGRTTALANHHFSQDAHLESIHRYTDSNPRVITYASSDTAIPLTYLRGSDQHNPLPLSCAPGLQLSKNTPFYSQVAYQQREQAAQERIGIVLDGTAITSVPNVCSEQQIEQQLGQPVAVSESDDGSLVLLYPAAAATNLRF